jgi:hypothetical protein
MEAFVKRESERRSLIIARNCERTETTGRIERNGRIHIIQGVPDSIRQFLIIYNQSIQQHMGKWESTFCCR